MYEPSNTGENINNNMYISPATYTIPVGAAGICPGCGRCRTCGQGGPVYPPFQITSNIGGAIQTALTAVSTQGGAAISQDELAKMEAWEHAGEAALGTGGKSKIHLAP